MQPYRILKHRGETCKCGETLRVDITSMQGVIRRSDVRQLLKDHRPVDIFDMTDVMKTVGDPSPVGRAYISNSGFAVMYSISGALYCSPLAQVRGVVDGTRKSAEVSVICWGLAPEPARKVPV